MKNKKIIFITVIVVILFGFICLTVAKGVYNNPENVEKRAIEFCIKQGFEFRQTLSSDASGNNNQCITNEYKYDLIEYYNLNKNKK